MKFLDSPILAQLTELLDGVDCIGGGSRLYARLEAYSCKRAGSDKKLYKSLEQQYQVELSKSPGDELSLSPFGPLVEPASRKTLIDLISLLNAAFPDYDFCNVRPEQFIKESNLNMVINSINTTLAAAIPDFNNTLAPRIWSAIEAENTSLKECDIYSYLPDYDSDPYAEEGSIWSFNYFFYSKKNKRIVFFTCVAVSKNSESDHQPDDDLFLEQEDMEF